MVKLKLSTDALKTIDKLGLEAMAKKAGIDLNKLPFKDLRPERKEYLQKHKMEVPVSKKTVTGFYRKTYRLVREWKCIVCIYMCLRARVKLN